MKFPPLYAVVNRTILEWRIEAIDYAIVITEELLNGTVRCRKTNNKTKETNTIRKIQLEAEDQWFEKYDGGYYLSEWSVHKHVRGCKRVSLLKRSS